MTRNEKIEYVLRILNRQAGAWKGVDDKTLDLLVFIVQTYLKTERAEEIDKEISLLQAEKETLTKEAV